MSNGHLFKVSAKELIHRLERLTHKELAFIIDEEFSLHHQELLENLKTSFPKGIFKILKGGEACKSFENWKDLSEELLSRGVNRSLHLVGIGGGALTDLVGFVSATLLRGVSWSVIPTTVLSQIDAGIGGKTAINSHFGKNLIGAFHEPENVFLCEELTHSLSEEERRSGFGELLKYAFLDKDIHRMIIKEEKWSDIFYQCSLYKKKIVSQDLKENGKRKILNYGHTFGHAYEFLTKDPHGIAVLWGIEFIDKYFQDSKFEKIIDELKKKLDLWPIYKEVQLDQVFELIKKDKKKTSNQGIDLILIEEVGKPLLENMSFSQIKEKICLK